MIKDKISLHMKILLSGTLAIILTSVLLTGFFIQKQSKVKTACLENKAYLIAKNIVIYTSYLSMHPNIGLLPDLNDQILKENNVIYSLSYDIKGNLVSSYGNPDKYLNDLTLPEDRKLDFKEFSVGSMGTHEKSKLYSGKRYSNLYEIIVPVLFSNETTGNPAEIAGFNRIGISLEDQDPAISYVINLLPILFIVLSIFFIFIFLVNNFFKVIKKLAIGIQKIANGDFNHKTIINSNNELGDMSQSLNRIGDTLMSSEATIKRGEEDLYNMKIVIDQKNSELDDTISKMRNIQNELLRSEKFAVIGRLAASVAHELRNPLASLKNISYYLLRLESLDDEKARKMIGLMSNDVKRANKIVTELLDFSRVKKITKIPTMMQNFIEDFLITVDLGDNIILKKEIENFQANIDQDRLTQVMINLAVNAKEAMPEGGELTISVKSKGEVFEILVKDTGMGMDKDVVDRIFEPLFTTKTKGLGLGLAIVKEIIVVHCGKIRVFSQKNIGTTFELTLPL